MDRIIRGVLVAAGLLGLSSAVGAAPNAPKKPPAVGQSLGVPVSAQALAGYRGGHVFQLGEAQLSAQLNDNRATDNLTGTNIVTQQALSGASGIPTVIQNSGNNVIIQNATILNVQMQ